jgi:hypothetical protein
MKKYFLVYDDEKHDYEKLRKNLLESVKKFSNFETILFKRSNIDKEFIEKNKHIFQIPVGDGSWLWKPYIIHKTLEKVEYGDLVFYMDASYFFVEDFRRLYEDLIKTRDVLVWKNKPNENINSFWHLCHSHVIEKYGMKDRLFQKNDCCEPWAGAILFKKTEFAVSFVKEWLEMCQIKEDLWGDEEGFAKQKRPYSENYRIQHRNDQSLLGILLYKYDIQMEFFEKKYLQNRRHPW